MSSQQDRLKRQCLKVEAGSTLSPIHRASTFHVPENHYEAIATAIPLFSLSLRSLPHVVWNLRVLIEMHDFFPTPRESTI